MYRRRSLGPSPTTRPIHQSSEAVCSKITLMPFYYSKKSVCPSTAIFPVVRYCQAISIKVEMFCCSLSRQVNRHQIIKIKKGSQLLDQSHIPPHCCFISLPFSPRLFLFPRLCLEVLQVSVHQDSKHI